MIDQEFISRGLSTTNLVPKIVAYETLDSTNEEAKRCISSGECENLLIIAESQTKGRGRYDRQWISPEGGLYFSLVLRPHFGLESAPLYNMLCACAVTTAIQSFGINAHVKWPNDILIFEDKVAGILSELLTEDPEDILLVLGVGVNLNTTRTDFPENLRDHLTTLADHLNKQIPREELLVKIIKSIDQWLTAIDVEKSFSSVLKDWKKKSATLGNKVRIIDGAKSVIGIARDILDDGSLVLSVEGEADDIIFRAGDVTHLRQD
ncbi:MAG: biotin--[acetyl-CoA-carboxylase] ligase [Candidatus Thorarchaeota archaeon]|nr:biotin--[acetyl-CoA-carboxylase] ligase [Candidatus Thorarchaeota archaeon]